MPRRNRKGGRRRRGGQTQLNTTLKQIETNTRTERPYDPPSVSDKIPMQLSNKKVVTFKRSTVGPTISVSTSSTTFGGSAYYLASFDPNSEIQFTYSFYRIIEITVKFVPTNTFVNVFDESNDAVADLGHTHTVIDTSAYGSTVPISIAELEQYKTHQVVPTGKPFSRTWTPHAAIRVYGGLTDGYAMAPSGMWMAANTNDIEYYGIRWALSQVVGIASGSAVYTTQIDAVIQTWAAL